MEAMRNWPEFAGYKPRIYPGQMAPRLPVISPRRMDLPPTPSVEWKSKRPARTIVITVTPPDDNIEEN